MDVYNAILFTEILYSAVSNIVNTCLDLHLNKTRILNTKTNFRIGLGRNGKYDYRHNIMYSRFKLEGRQGCTVAAQT